MVKDPTTSPFQNSCSKIPGLWLRHLNNSQTQHACLFSQPKLTLIHSGNLMSFCRWSLIVREKRGKTRLGKETELSTAAMAWSSQGALDALNVSTPSIPSRMSRWIEEVSNPMLLGDVTLNFARQYSVCAKIVWVTLFCGWTQKNIVTSTNYSVKGALQ